MKYSILFLSLITLFFVSALPTQAGTIDDLRQQIQDRQAKIDAIEKQIAQYQRELDTTTTAKKSLESAIRALDISRKKLAADIRLTQNKIARTGYSIQKLNLEIANNTDRIHKDRAVIAKSLREIQKIDSQSFLEKLLAKETISNVWNVADTLIQFQGALQANIRSLNNVQVSLQKNKESLSQKQKKLAEFKTNLSNQKSSIDINRQAKNNLLRETKNKESNYQKLIRQKREAQREFEQELSSLESQLKIAIDPKALPTAGSGVLAWPFSNSFIQGCKNREGQLGNIFCITQYFGNTPFATKNPQIYNGSGHNGVDFGAPTGTPVLSTLSGTVVETGNTDQYPGCFSYGKWVLIKHANGLSSLYAHLSKRSVTAGQKVGTGELIGYSGSTGFSTGPHLHLTVFASEGVRVVRFGDVRTRTNCPDARIPIAPKKAYLNPLSYL